MCDRIGVFRAIESWCGARPDRGSESLQALWDRTRGSVEFTSGGAELLIRALESECGRVRLRPADLACLTVDDLVQAMPPAA